MRGTTTLFVINNETPDTTITEAAENAAKTDTHLSCLLFSQAPSLPMNAYGVLPYGGIDIPDNWADILTESRRALTKRESEIEALLAASNVSGRVQSAVCATSDLSALVSRQARVSDMTSVASNLHKSPETMRQIAYGVLFNSPAGLFLNASPSLKPKKVFVAWNGSLASSRAAHLALPYLKEASEVVVGCFDPVNTADQDGADPGTDVAAWLSHHGCKVEIGQYPSGGEEIGKCILDRARDTGAELIVLGAYGHARLLQAVFGGTTRTVMEQTAMPALFAH